MKIKNSYIVAFIYTIYIVFAMTALSNGKKHASKEKKVHTRKDKKEASMESKFDESKVKTKKDDVMEHVKTEGTEGQDPQNESSDESSKKSNLTESKGKHGKKHHKAKKNKNKNFGYRQLYRKGEIEGVLLYLIL